MLLAVSPYSLTYVAVLQALFRCVLPVLAIGFTSHEERVVAVLIVAVCLCLECRISPLSLCSSLCRLSEERVVAVLIMAVCPFCRTSPLSLCYRLLAVLSPFSAVLHHRALWVVRGESDGCLDPTSLFLCRTSTLSLCSAKLNWLRCVLVGH